MFNCLLIRTIKWWNSNSRISLRWGVYDEYENKNTYRYSYFFALNVNASEAVLEENIANLWINDLDHHTDVALLKEGDQYYIECNILAERQITTSQLKTLSSRPEFCSVSSGVIQSAFDDTSQSIKLTIPTEAAHEKR